MERAGYLGTGISLLLLAFKEGRIHLGRSMLPIQVQLKPWARFLVFLGKSQGVLVLCPGLLGLAFHSNTRSGLGSSGENGQRWNQAACLFDVFE